MVVKPHIFKHGQKNINGPMPRMIDWTIYSLSSWFSNFGKMTRKSSKHKDG